MASGLPDYYSRSYVNIDQQTISELAIDIAKQSLANLDININKQTVSELAIDIAKQTISRLNIDIAEQSVGNLAMDIAQQSLGNLAVDIGSQSIGNLDIDIKNQSIGELSIDIAKQTIGQILQRPIYGTAHSVEFTGSKSTIGTHELISVSGQGKIYGGWLNIDSDNDHMDDTVYFYLDGNLLFYQSFRDYFEKGLMGSPVYGCTLLKYDKVNNNASIGFPSDLTFESGFTLKYYVGVSNSVDILAQIYYALI